MSRVQRGPVGSSSTLRPFEDGFGLGDDQKGIRRQHTLVKGFRAISFEVTKWLWRAILQLHLEATGHVNIGNGGRRFQL